MLREAHNLEEFHQLWIEAGKRRQLIDHLLGDNFVPDVTREAEKMNAFDLFDFFGHHGYRALKRVERGGLYVSVNADWFAGMEQKAATVLKGFGQQFALGGTNALESGSLFDVPEIKLAGGMDALKALGKPVDVVREAKGRLFGI